MLLLELELELLLELLDDDEELLLELEVLLPSQQRQPIVR